MSRSNIKTGWWKVNFDLTLEDEKVKFDNLSETTQEYIVKCISEGYTQGEIIEEGDEPDDDEEDSDEGTGSENRCQHCTIDHEE